MKKNVLTVISILTLNLSFAQTTATDFTTNDCSGTSHHLFAELDAGKIIVAAFVMPCGACAAPSLAAYNAVQSYATSNPNTVYFYLVDDIGTTSCSTLTGWGNSNSMSGATTFSSTDFTMSDYGSPGMPKIVVLGGTDHAIVYNQNSGVTTSGVQNAVNGLLASADLSVIKPSGNFDMKVIPNPASKDFHFEYNLEKSSDVVIEIFSLTGQLVYSQSESNQAEGNHTLNIGDKLNLEKGTYLLKLTTDSKSESISIMIEK